MFISKLTAWLITVGFALASIGALGQATLYLAKKAVQSYQYDQFSLAKWNRALVSNFSKK
ncbi:hypothetical protein HZA26_01870 [Candidatus Nomurabacteria bacterium]|nr:hypothetical protein [Candidatus Nomurabacteria bacterium]